MRIRLKAPLRVSHQGWVSKVLAIGLGAIGGKAECPKQDLMTDHPRVQRLHGS